MFQGLNQFLSIGINKEGCYSTSLFCGYPTPSSKNTSILQLSEAGHWADWTLGLTWLDISFLSFQSGAIKRCTWFLHQPKWSGQAEIKKVQYFLWGEKQVIFLRAGHKMSSLLLSLLSPHIKRTSCSIPEPSPCSFIVIYLTFKTLYFTLNFKLSSFSSLLLSFPISDSCSLFDTGQVTEPWPCNYGWSHRAIFMPCQRLFTYQECIFKWQALNCPLKIGKPSALCVFFQLCHLSRLQFPQPHQRLCRAGRVRLEGSSWWPRLKKKKQTQGKEREHVTPPSVERGNSLEMEEGLSCCPLGLTFLSAWLLLDPRVSVLLCSSAWQLLPISNQWPRGGMRTLILGQMGQELIAPITEYLSLQALIWWKVVRKRARKKCFQTARRRFIQV